MQTSIDYKTLATRYIEACGKHDYDAVAQYLSPDVSFRGPNMESTGSDAFIGALKRMTPIWVRNDIHHVFVDGATACVVYDFVTNTETGPSRAVEVLEFRDDRIAGIDLLFDRVKFAQAVQALSQLAQRQ
jgi:hypothetical protein